MLNEIGDGKLERIRKAFIFCCCVQQLSSSRHVVFQTKVRFCFFPNIFFFSFSFVEYCFGFKNDTAITATASAARAVCS